MMPLVKNRIEIQSKEIFLQVDPWGQVIAQCTEGTGIAIASINLDYVKKVRLNLPVFNHRRTDLYPEITVKRSQEALESEFYPFGQVSYKIMLYSQMIVFIS